MKSKKPLVSASMKVDQIKKKLRALNKPVTGNKATLLGRLRRALATKKAPAKKRKKAPAKKSLVSASMKVDQIKKKLRALNKPVTGNKATLLGRLRRALAAKKPSRKAPVRKAAAKKSAKPRSGKTRWKSGKSIGAPYYWFIGSTAKGNLSNKYWAGKVSGNELIIHHGRVGTAGRIGRKKFSSAAAARAELLKRRRAKINKGYMRVNPKRKCMNPSMSDLKKAIMARKRRKNPCGHKWHRKMKNP